MQPDTERAPDAIQDLVWKYFEGLHYADVEKLNAVFSPDCVLKAPGLRRTLDEWFNLIKSRPVPAERGDKFGSRILSIEILGDQAVAKVYVPLLGNHFIDYLGLLKENERWLIVNKMYADAPEVSP